MAGAYSWQPYHLHVPTVLKSGNLKLLEPSGPVQACNGIAFKSLFILPKRSAKTNMQIAFKLNVYHPEVFEV